MNSAYPTQSTMVHRVRRSLLQAEERPVVFICGAGISGSVLPSTARMVEHFRAAVASDQTDLRDFDNVVGGVSTQHRYQEAAKFLIERTGIDTLNRAIRLAVLSARTPSLSLEVARPYLANEERLRELELDTLGWAVPRGTSALGRVLALIPPEKRGPILTTNFDPLIEVSLSLAGLTPMPIAADSEGAIALPDVPDPRIVPVAHLHGYWRSGDTLHTGAQLGRSRPRLIGSLRQIMTGCVAVVLGYGGWDDVLTRAIGDLVAEGAERELEILWSSFGAEPSLGVLAEAELPGRLQTYVNVDANKLLPKIEKEVRDRVGEPRALAAVARVTARIGNLTAIDESFVRTYTGQTLDPSGVISFFNGRAPEWTDVVDERLPLLSWSDDVLQKLTAANSQETGVVLLAPAGEGKSTGLRQVALNLSRNDRTTVYWANPVAPLPVQEILDITASSRITWIVCDDADLKVEQLLNLVRKLRSTSRSDVRLLLAARDTDWSRATSSGRSFSSKELLPIHVGGLTRGDAALIVAAWARHGAEGLGALSGVEGREAQSEALFYAGQGEDDSALLGAMLSVRFSTRFDEHVRELMSRLERVQLPNGANLLAIYLTICHAYRFSMPGAKRSHLTALLGVSLNEVDALVVARLGREAAVQRHGEFIVPRHGRVADTAARLGGDMGYRAEELFPALVGSVVSEFRGRRWGPDEVELIYSGQRIANKATAIAAVNMAVEQEPIQFRLVSSQLGVHRKFHLLAEGWDHANQAWLRRDDMDDWRIGLRPFLVQWAWLGQLWGRGRESAALNACALLDIPGADKVDVSQGVRGMCGLSIALEMFRIGTPAQVAAWRGTLLDLSMELGLPDGFHDRVESALKELKAGGIRIPETPDEIRTSLRDCVGTVIRGGAIGPARTFRSEASHLQSLFDLIDI